MMRTKKTCLRNAEDVAVSTGCAECKAVIGIWWTQLQLET